MISGFLKIIIILLVFIAYHNDRSKKKKQIKRKKDRKRKRPAKISKRHLFQFSNIDYFIRLTFILVHLSLESFYRRHTSIRDT